METGIGDVGGSGNKQFNIPASNVDRVFHGYQYSHHNPYADMTGLGMGLDMLGDVNPMFVPNYNLYNPHHANLKLNSHIAAAHEPVYQQSNGYQGYGVPDPVPQYGSGKSKKKSGTALSALTLLAFLFFLNLLQSCLKEHINAMNPTVLVMTAGSRHSSLPIDRFDYEDVEEESREISNDHKNFHANSSSTATSKNRLRKKSNGVLEPRSVDDDLMDGIEIS